MTRSCVVAMAALGTMLALTKRRLMRADDELARLRSAVARGDGTGSVTTLGRVVAAPAAPVTATTAAEMAAQWEQAIPPMDS